MFVYDRPISVAYNCMLPSYSMWNKAKNSIVLYAARCAGSFTFIYPGRGACAPRYDYGALTGLYAPPKKTHGISFSSQHLCARIPLTNPAYQVEWAAL